MKITVHPKLPYIALLVAVLLFMALPAMAQGTTPDHQAIAVEETPVHLLVAEDGTCYLAGQNSVRKYGPDGSWETDWGDAGKAVIPIRPALLCFDGNGDLLAGSPVQEGLYRIAASDGSSELVIPAIPVSGVAVDAGQHLYLNTQGKLAQYTGDGSLVWEKPLSNPAETGLSLLPDGGLLTTIPASGTLCKYTPQGELDITFGTGGMLQISDGPIGPVLPVGRAGQAQQTDYNGLYVACYPEGVVKRLSDDGHTIETVMTGLTGSSLLAVTPAYYYLADETGSIRLIERPVSHMAHHNFTYTITPAVLGAGSTEPVVIQLTSISPKAYTVSARFIQDTIPDILTGTATLADGRAALAISPPETGWQKGQYAIRLVFTDDVDGVTVTESMVLESTITVKNLYTVTFYADGVEPVVKTVLEGESLTDIPPVPLKPGYIGVWSVNNFLDIHADMVVNAVYTRITYTVTFKVDGYPDIIKIVEDGEPLTDIPPVPARKGYTGEWDTTDFSNITSDIVVNAVYTRITYTVTFKADGQPDIIIIVGEGDTLTDLPSVSAKKGYTGEWDTADFSNITSDIVVNAVYTRITHTVTFKADGHPAIIRIVGEGDTLTDIPPVPPKMGFAGKWKTTRFSNITADMVVRAVYTELTIPTLSQEDLTVTGVEGTQFGYFTKMIYQPVTDEQRQHAVNGLLQQLVKDKKLVHLFEVQLLHQDIAVQPDGKILLTLALTEAMQQYTHLQVVWLPEDGEPVVLDSTVREGHILFTTDRVGQWAIIGDAPKKGVTITIPSSLFIFLFLGAVVFSGKKIVQVY